MTAASGVDERHVVVRLLFSAAERYRPTLGWTALVIALTLALLPAFAIREAEWIDLRRVRVTLEWVGFLSLLSGWWLVGRLRRWASRLLSPAADDQSENESPSTSPKRSRLHG